MEIRFVSTLTPEDEETLATALLRAISSLLDETSLAYTVRIQTAGERVHQHSHPAVAAALLTFLHIAVACARGGRFRRFLWPPGNLVWSLRRMRRPGFYRECRDGLWNFVTSLRLPYYFWLGLCGFFGTLAWLIVPATLMAAGAKVPVLGVIGAILLAVIAPWIPFLQVGFAVDGRFRQLFARRDARDRFRRAPWAFALALLVLLIAAIPLREEAGLTPARAWLLRERLLPRPASLRPQPKGSTVPQAG